MRKTGTILIVLCVLSIVGVACAAPASTPDPAKVSQEIAQAVSQTVAAIPSPTMYPTNTPYPTLTPIPPTSSPTLSPTPQSTNTPASTSTATLAPTAKPTNTPAAPPPPSLGSRSNPISKGQALSLDENGFQYSIKITKTMRGDEAWAKLKADNMFNGQIKDMEYLLIYVVGEVTAGPKDKQFSFSASKFNSLTNNKLYSGPMVVVGGEFNSTGFAPYQKEGWVALVAFPGDATALVNYRPSLFDVGYYLAVTP